MNLDKGHLNIGKIALEESSNPLLIHRGGHGGPAYFKKFQHELYNIGIPTEIGSQPSNSGFPPAG